MAVNGFSTSGAQTANVLLGAIPQEQQLAVAKGLTARLQAHFDETAASVVLQLVEHQTDQLLRQDVASVLIARIEEGQPESVARLLKGSGDLSESLINTSKARLRASAGQCLSDHGFLVTGFAGRLQATGFDNASESTNVAVVSSWLRYARLVVSPASSKGHISSLLRSGLVLLGSNEDHVALAAKDLVFNLLKFGIVEHDGILPRAIDALISAQGFKLHQTLGYSLWNRCLSATNPDKAPLVRVDVDEYWAPIQSGLRNGDSERRKLCLDILKRSVALAIDIGRQELVTRRADATTAEIIAQYTRYCTVFETLVLARYANLVIECERDLALLASSSSAVKSEWLHTLLATGLDPRIQDQNRKFIGRWVLRSSLDNTKNPESFVTLFGNEFLSWAMEGHNFVSTTKQHHGELRCSHGDELAGYIARLLQQFDQAATDARQLVDAMLEFLVRHHNTMFAYSAVHLLRGIGKALQSNPSLCLNPKQLEQLLEIASWRSLPEIATDFIILQCLSIYQASELRSAASIGPALSKIAVERLKNLRAAVAVLKKAASQNLCPAELDTVKRSQRELAIEATVVKCNLMIDPPQTPSIRRSDIQASLEDIWSDLEYLEYPREVLIKVPAAIFNRRIITLALEEQDSQTGMRAFLRATLPRVQDLAQRRSFLLAPLMESMRAVLMSTPAATDIFDIEDFFLNIARSPSSPSVDLKLEYSVLPLLAAYSEGHSRLDQAYYFGEGEGYGFAAYLDLVSRTGATHPQLMRALLDSMFARWKRQKTPPPTMTAWKTTLQLQVMLLCFEQYAKTVTTKELAPLVKDLYFILSIEPLPRFRYLMEWMIVRLQQQHPELQTQTLTLLDTKDHHSNPKYLASLSKIGVMLASTPSASEDFATELAAAFIAMSSSSKIVIRHEAQWSFPLLMDQARSRGWKSITANKAYVSLDHYIRSLPRFGDPPPERVWSKLDLAEDHTMTNLVEGLWTQLDYTRAPYARREDFVALSQGDAQRDVSAWPASCIPLGPPIPQPVRPEPTEDGESKSLLGPKQMTQDEAIALQTKGTAYLKSSIDDSDAASRKHELILVASLIENPYNLGGLSRVSEIFGAQAMYVRDPRIIAEKDFTSVAVSSHNHLDIQPLTPPDMSNFLTQKRNEGWTVVGIEQTDRSVLLGSTQCSLPEKSILVLGSEREGMPAAVLGECDILVEIPQIGVTRSMNVQTAAAVVLYEYGRQHKK